MRDTPWADDLVTARDRFARMLPILEFIHAGGLPTTVEAGLDDLGVVAGVVPGRGSDGGCF